MITTEITNSAAKSATCRSRLWSPFITCVSIPSFKTSRHYRTALELQHQVRLRVFLADAKLPSPKSALRCFRFYNINLRRETVASGQDGGPLLNKVLPNYLPAMNVCVFGSSSKNTNEAYTKCAFRLGELIAERGHTCVNGAGRFGVMGAVNSGCDSKGGKIIGVIHSIFCVDASEHPHIKDMVVVGGIDLYQRKLELFNNSDCILVLPGGVGTFDELWDGVTARSLGMKGMSTKPICIVNIDGYFDGSLQQMRRAKADGILYDDVSEYFQVENDVESALAWCEAAVHSHRKAPMDSHERKVERQVLRNNNVEEVDPVQLEKPVHLLRPLEESTTVVGGQQGASVPPPSPVSASLPRLVPAVLAVMAGMTLSRIIATRSVK